MDRSFIKSSLMRILALIKKEMLGILMDGNTRIVLFVPLIVQCVIFGYGASFHLEHVPYTIYNLSNDNLSHEIVTTINNTKRFELTKNCNSNECLKQSVDSQESLLGIYIDSDFKNTHQLSIITDARNTASANTALGYLNSIISDVNEKYFSKSPVSINSRYLFNENNYTRYTILVGMTLALSVIQVMLLSSLSISREKEEGTYDMMLMTPARPIEILIGKAIPPILIAMTQSFILILIINFYFDIPLRGSALDIGLLLLMFSMAVVGLGLAISTLSKTTMQSLVAAFCICLVSIMASGMLTSVDGMPNWFKVVSYIDPLYYGISAIWKIYLQGIPLIELWDVFLPLCITGIISMTISTRLFRKKIE